ncbi:transcription termination/antitermination protein NusA [Candidatus Saccharibacteria bacterium]|nr:transcription termination/antitermination protein NusA [Candidatus Saccharibacteria bacterium]
MENLDLRQMSAMVDIIAEEKGLPRETVLGVIEQAIAAAWRKDNGDREMSVRAVLNTNTGEATVYVAREVIEEGLAYNPSTEIPLDKAPEGSKLGDIVEEKFVVKDFGRVAAMTAKQVVLQRLREAENDAVLVEFEDKVGTVVTGTVARVEPRIVRVDLGRASGIMPRSEQIDGEYYAVGSRIKVLIKKIEKNDKGAQLILSRGSAGFVEYLFRQEVPEIDNGTVSIKGIAREAGRRTKIAVAANVSGVDPVGTFVGGRGIRVQAVMNEIGDREKIDIVTWSDNASEYIREALSPAEAIKVEIDGKRAKVYVSEDQQSIAIGKQGQNVRLASKLTGYEIDIEVQKTAPKKKKKNVEDSLLGALEEAEEVEEMEDEGKASEANTPSDMETPEKPASETAEEAVGEVSEE